MVFYYMQGYGRSKVYIAAQGMLCSLLTSVLYILPYYEYIEDIFYFKCCCYLYNSFLSNVFVYLFLWLFHSSNSDSNGGGGINKCYDSILDYGA